MKIRASQALIYSPREGEISAYNYITKSVFGCSTDTIKFLTLLNEWHEIRQAECLCPEIDSDEMRANIAELIKVDAIVEEGSPLDQAEAEIAENWEWGLPAALLHFSLSNNQFQTKEEIEELQREKVASIPSPKLFTKNTEYDQTIQLQNALPHNELLQLMARRRTVREPATETISLHQLKDCLFAGMGIIGHTSNCVGELPISMTPSGGARNPYEAYIYARNVVGLDLGFYHYSAIENSLGRLPTSRSPNPSEFLAGQEWADAMPCIILLVAKFERTMWKYADGNAYRAACIEAGHIGQNIMLLATQHRLTACPTAAFCHTLIHDCLGISSLTQSVVYALALAVPNTDTETVLYPSFQTSHLESAHIPLQQEFMR